MSLFRRSFLLSAAVVLLSAGQIFAGGFKRNGTIRVTNRSTQTVGVYYDSTNAAIQTAINNDTDSTTFLADFQAAGGVILSPGGTTTFSVKGGTYSFLAFDTAQVSSAFAANGSISDGALLATLSIHVHAGERKKVFVINSTTNPPANGDLSSPDISLLDP